jgi:hypothetical protein
MAHPPRSGSPRPGTLSPADVRVGEPYEVSEGHRIEVLPAGPRHGRANLVGGSVLATDPAVRSAGVDVGFAADARTLRAPDVAVGDFGDGPHWAQGAPPLAVEYADHGQDEADLRRKVSELLRAGGRFVWVVRLMGPRRVEVHEAGQAMRVVYPGDELLAPGILQNPVPVTALFEPSAAQEVMLRNLLQRHGYKNLEHVVAASRAEGHEAGRQEGHEAGLDEGRRATSAALLSVLRARGLAVSEALVAQVSAERDLAVLERLVVRAALIARAEDLFDA